MKRAKVFLHDRLAGRLVEDENGFTFTYDAEYLPEGWLLDIAERSWKINQRDRMSLLLACCKDCIGAVSVIPDDETEEDKL